MGVKEKVLEFLEGNKGQIVSGAKIAESIGISRTAVWKAIQSLEEDGYNITASTKKGYCLNETTDILSAHSIKPFLPEALKEIDLVILDKTTSTNTVAKQLASEGKAEMTVVIANEQTEGKGRYGRTFVSPALNGIYMSIILRPKMSAQEALFITTSTAVAVSKAIEEICFIDTQIKWVNDLYFEEKKLCGILTEATLDFETGGLMYAVVGIGVNLYAEEGDFPDELKKIVTSIYKNGNRRPIKSKLIAKIIENIYSYSENLGDKKILSEYKKRSFIIGKNIDIIKGEKKLPAKAVDINDRGELVVKLENGKLEALNSGEVSIRI